MTVRTTPRIVLAVVAGLLAAGCDDVVDAFQTATDKGGSDVEPQPPLDAAARDALARRVEGQKF